MQVPLFDLKRLISPLKEELLIEAERVMCSANFILGSDVYKFERIFGESVGSEYCLATSSGTDALLAIFMSLDLPPGSEIIVPSFTFIASATAIIRAGLKPVFVDLAPNSFHPSCDTIKRVWTKNTKGVLFVHLFGEPEDLSDIKSLCDDNGAVLIEDCAQSYGSTAGRVGLASAYSFFPAKNLGCLGDGGAVTTNSKDLADRIKIIRAHGSKVKYSYEVLGGNFRLDTIQASFLNVLLKEVDDWIERRRENAEFYSKSLTGIGDLALPKDRNGHAWNQYTLRTSKRDSLKEHLDSRGIGSAIYYPIPLHESSHIFGSSNNLIETENRCKEVLSIPVYPGLTTSEREIVVAEIKEFFK